MNVREGPMTREQMTNGSGVVALVALGSNLSWGEVLPTKVLAGATERLITLGGVERCSGIWRTDAWPDPTRPAYLNLCVRLRTHVGPHALLEDLLAIEAEFGRVRGKANADRTLDLDLIDYDGQVLESCGSESQASGGHTLVLPHPRMHERAFVLLPLRDVAPTWRHPASGRSVDELLSALAPEAKAGAARVLA